MTQTFKCWYTIKGICKEAVEYTGHDKQKTTWKYAPFTIHGIAESDSILDLSIKCSGFHRANGQYGTYQINKIIRVKAYG